MHLRLSRTALAAVLMTAMVAVPAAVGWVVGSRAVAREAASGVQLAELRAHETASRLAERLQGRLEAALLAEDRRPYWEYEHRYREVGDRCDCAPWVESPLARGPVESLLEAHFEVDRRLRLTLPTVPDDALPADAAPPPACTETERALARQRALRGTLQESAAAIARTLLDDPRFGGDAGGRDGDAPGGVAVAAGFRIPEPPDGRPVIHGEASALVGPFRWVTLPVAGVPRLAAVRPVLASDGSRWQGWLVSAGDVETLLSTEILAATLRPEGPEDGCVSEPLALPGAAWEIAVDAGTVIAEARARGEALRTGFVRMWAGGTGLVALAAVFVVGMVGQSERMARQRSRFAAAAAHELRTPLAGMRLYGDMLAEGLGDPDRRERYARQIAVEADRLGRVVSNVLGYTNLERGTGGVQAAPGDLGAVVADGVERLTPSLEANGAVVELEVERGLPPVALDADAVFRILQNLLDNAERYGREAADRRITVSVAARPGGAELAVRDRGPGVPERERRRLFEPFRRGDRADAPAGLGLGLAIVRALATSLGGSVRHEPAPGGGARFVVALRAVPAA